MTMMKEETDKVATNMVVVCQVSIWHFLPCLIKNHSAHIAQPSLLKDLIIEAQKIVQKQ